MESDPRKPQDPDHSRLGACNVILNEDTLGRGRLIDISIRYKMQYSAPIICLDASANENVYQFVLEDTHSVFFEELPPAKDPIFRVAVIGQGFSKSSLFYDGKAQYEDKGVRRTPAKEAEIRREQVEAAFEKIADKEKAAKFYSAQ